MVGTGTGTGIFDIPVPVPVLVPVFSDLVPVRKFWYRYNADNVNCQQPNRRRTYVPGIDRDHQSRSRTPGLGPGLGHFSGLGLGLGWAIGLGLGLGKISETKLGKVALKISKIDFLGAKFHCKYCNTTKFQNFGAIAPKFKC